MKTIFVQSSMLYPAQCHPCSQFCLPTLLTPCKGSKSVSEQLRHCWADSCCQAALVVAGHGHSSTLPTPRNTVFLSSTQLPIFTQVLGSFILDIDSTFKFNGIGRITACLFLIYYSTCKFPFSVSYWQFYAPEIYEETLNIPLPHISYAKCSYLV